MQQPDGDGGLVEPHVGQDVGDVERMDEVRLARAAHLSAMLARGEDVGAFEQLLIEVRLVALDFVEDVFEADHGDGNEALESRSGLSRRGERARRPGTPLAPVRCSDAGRNGVGPWTCR